MANAGFWDGNFGMRARRLLALRWAAICGQIVTVLTVQYFLDIDLPLLPMAILIAASVLINLYLQFFRKSARIGEAEAIAYILFDTAQLTAMLYLAGGLQNPFAAMMLVYVMIAASVLSRRGAIVVGGFAFACLTFLAFVHHPLPWRGGGLLLERLYSCGVWTALCIAAAFTSIFIGGLVREARQMAAALAETRAALLREQRLSALGGLAAAAAHRLATPLNTITLIAHDLIEELPQGKLRDDAQLLLRQAQSCKDSLSSLARDAASAPDDEQPQRLPWRAAIELIAEKHAPQNAQIKIAIEERGIAADVELRPELVHALGNILHNAHHHAASRIDVAVAPYGGGVELSIRDDGPGFAATLLPHLGEPYIKRGGQYDGLGLGLFIAKSLLEKMGGDISFANNGGAEVRVRLPQTAEREMAA